MDRPGIEALAGFLDEESSRLRRRAAACLAASDAEEAVEPLARALSDISADVRSAAMHALAARVPADSRLVAFLNDPDAGVRAEAVKLCGRQHPDLLASLIGDSSKSVQIAALKVLRDFPDFAADKALIATLRENLGKANGELAAASARALATVAPQAAIDELISMLGETTRPVDARLGALQGLTELGGERVVEALAGRIGDEERSIRLETMSALARLSLSETDWPNTAGEALLFALRGGYEPEFSQESEAQTAATPALQGAEDDKPAPVAVTETEDDSGAYPTSTLSAILEDAPNVREVVGLPGEGVDLTPMDMERLAVAKRIKGKKRVPLAPIVVLHEDIRRFAARVLGDLNHADVARELAAVLKNADTELCLAAADSLARIGVRLSPLPDAVTQILMERAAVADRDLKLLMIRALAAAGGEAAPDFLAEQIENEDSFVRAEAVRALSRLGRTGSWIEALLGDPDPAVRLCAAQAVAAARGDDALKLLTDFAFSFEGYHGRHAARLLRELDAARASTLFVEVLKNPDDKRTWSVAIEALEELNCEQPVLTAEV